MKKENIKVSGIYAVKIGRNTLGIRIMRQNPDGHWVGINVKTNKQVLIKSADRFCGVYHAKRGKAAKDQEMAAIAKKERATAKPGGLNGAVRVLTEAGGPLGCSEMVKQMLEKGYWKTGGKTPAATISSAIIREIKVKGDASRFRKTERGKFELAK